VSAELERSPLDDLGDRWQRAWSGHASFADCCTADIRYEDPVALDPIDGIEPLEVHAGMLRRAFPDLRVEASAPRLRSGANAVFPWRLAGTHKGDLGPLPATDRFVTLHGIHYVELDDDRVRRARGFFDLYEAVTQLGLMPTRGSLGETALLLLRGFGIRR
jgi:steroid delta-isomerase-like uncharacterized protein